MRDYHLRCERDNRQEMRRLLKKLDIIDVDADGNITVLGGGAWDEIGTVVDWRTADQEGAGPVLQGPGGKPYWHYNLRTPVNIRKRIRNRAGDPDVDLLATELGRWFSKRGVTEGEDGDPDDLLLAVQPRRVFL